MLEKNEFKKSDGLNTYIAIWKEAGPALATEIARKSFRSVLLGVDEEQGLVEEIIGSLVDRSVPVSVISRIGARSRLMRDTLRAVYEDSRRLLKEIEKIRKKKSRLEDLQKKYRIQNEDD